MLFQIVCGNGLWRNIIALKCHETKVLFYLYTLLYAIYTTVYIDIQYTQLCKLTYCRLKVVCILLDIFLLICCVCFVFTECGNSIVQIQALLLAGFDRIKNQLDYSYFYNLVISAQFKFFCTQTCGYI